MVLCRYVIQQDRFLGASSVVLFAVHKVNRREVALKFYCSEGDFKRESDVHDKLKGRYTPR